MFYQDRVRIGHAPGVPGDLATLNPVVYSVHNYIAADLVKAGCFVWTVTPSDGDDVYKVSGKTTGTDKPIGLALRSLDHVSPLIGQKGGEEGSLDIGEGQGVTTAINADVFVVAKTAASVGQKVFAHKDGSGISTGAPGATISGAIETNWSVTSVSSGTAAGSLLVISNRGAA